MKTIIVDNEQWEIKHFQTKCKNIKDIQLLGSFTSPQKAIEFVAGNLVELAFLNMEMTEMNGQELAGKLRELIPEIIIIFVSVDDKHLSDEFRIKEADYYVMKPYSSKEIEAAITRAILLSGHLQKTIMAKTFGKFELIVNGEPFEFEDEKNKELLAFLIDHNGKPVSVDEISSVFFSKRESGAEGRLLSAIQISKLKSEMEKIRMSSAIEEKQQGCLLHQDVIDCDYYRFFKLDNQTIEQYQDNYMMDYPWAEATRKKLKQKKEEFQKKKSADLSDLNLEEEYKKLSESCEALQKRCDILKDSEETYRTAMTMTTHTVTMVDIPNKALCQIFNEGSWSGVQTTMTNAPESIIETGIIHQDDVEGYREFYRRIYAGSPAEQCSIRTLSENGHWFWFTMYTQTIFSDDGTPKYAICFSDDMTAQHEAELMYRQFVQIIIADAEYSWEANISQDTIIRLDEQSNDVIEGGNFASFREMNEISLGQIVPEDREMVRAKFNRIEMLQAYYDGERELRAEYRYRLPNSGNVIWMESVTYLIMDEKEDVHAIMTARDINDIKIQEEKEESQSANDPLCHINRRDTFDQKVRKRLEENKNGSLFMIDVDQFKDVNDTYGHLFGDRVLIDFANVVNLNFRSSDCVARYGGDEFVVYMEGNYNEKVIEAVTISLLNHIRSLKYENGYKGSVSVGVAQYKQGENLDDLYRRADRAMYQAKEKGRNTFYIGE